MKLPALRMNPLFAGLDLMKRNGTNGYLRPIKPTINASTDALEKNFLRKVAQ